MAKKHYTARYTLEDGDWLVEVAEVPQVHSFGRTLARAQTNIRDALALWVQAEDPSVLDIRDDFAGLPAAVVEEIAEVSKVREEAAALTARSQELTAHAAQQLVGTLGVTVRDAAHLLHISHQRVHQLVHDDQARSA
jgi:predicted RNase H-like HicB family nuclease